MYFLEAAPKAMAKEVGKRDQKSGVGGRDFPEEGHFMGPHESMEPGPQMSD